MARAFDGIFEFLAISSFLLSGNLLFISTWISAFKQKCRLCRFYFTRIISFMPVYSVDNIVSKNLLSERSCWQPFSSFVIDKYLFHGESFGCWLIAEPETVYFLGETSLENLSSYPTAGIYLELIGLEVLLSPCSSWVITFYWIQEDNF